MLWHHSRISFLRLSPIKKQFFEKNQGGDFIKMEVFRYFPSQFFDFFGEILVPNGSRAVPKGGWRCCKSFGTILGSVFFDFLPLKSNSLRKTKEAILSKWRFSVIFRVISLTFSGKYW